jgi:drug/metabolite transporter (DMT)-like permease
MFEAVAFGAGGAICLVSGMWFVWRQRRRNASTLAGWGLLSLGVGQLIRAAVSSTGDRQPLGVILAICSAVISGVGYILVACGGASFRNRRGRRKRRKLPPIRP